MTPLADVIAGIVQRHGVESLFPVLIFTALRPLGLLYGFVAFTWGMGQGRVIRVSVAVALGLPTLLADAAQIDALLERGRDLGVLVIGVKEVAIGYALGLFASLPIFALQFAGAVTDAFRGESDGGITDPTGGTMQTFSSLYLVIGLSAFFALGGLWTLTEVLYDTHAVWPMDRMTPPFAGDAALRVSQVLAEMLALTVRVAVPLLVLLAAIELTVAVAARIAKRFGLGEMAFPVKNLAALATLPLTAWFVWGVASAESDGGREALAMLTLLFDPGGRP